jgi:lipoprotein-anchoring transpeptidase ErfK/SrfK
MVKFKKIVFIIPLLLLIGVSYWYFQQLKTIENSNFIIINKANMTLSQYNYKGELLHQFKIATGKNFGDKTQIGDCKTPEGVFTIEEVVDASTWSHDFKGDKQGAIQGAYGPYFIRLNTPGQKGIGIHGTHDNNSIGNRASEGCIRLNNKDLTKLVENINTNSVVVITPGIEDVRINNNPNLPNNTDTEVKVEEPENKLIEGSKIVINR